MRGRVAEANALDDGALLARVAEGDLGALGAIYDRHRTALVRFVTHASAGAEDAEDVVQATFLAAAKIAARYDGRPSCRPWLIGIAARLLQERRRRVGRFFRALFHVRETSDASFDPTARVVARSELSAVERALARMTAAKRAVLVMAEVEEMPCEEIARTLQIPIGTVWTRLHAARGELRAALAREERS